MKVLVLSPHTDDGELGCGATMAKLVEEGNEVFCLAFSCCNNPDLVDEFSKASKIINWVKIIDNFPVRNFDNNRQAVLDAMIMKRDHIKPDTIFVPSANDLHQDHQVVYNEALRAFKHCTIYGYELPWNNLTFKTQAFFKVKADHLNKKIQALKEYKSQAHRNYMNEDFIKGLARVRGVQTGVEYAEAFEVIRIIK